MKVELRLVREEDLPRIKNWRMQPDVTRFMNTDPVLTDEGQLRWFQTVCADASQRQWVIWLEGEPVGMMSLMNIDRVNGHCGWGYYIAVAEKRSLQLAMFLEWNLYDYVFDVLKLHKLINDTFVENAAVVKLHLLCGGRQEGVLRHQICKNGRYYDVSIGSILAEEWAAQKGRHHYDHFLFEEPPAADGAAQG